MSQASGPWKSKTEIIIDPSLKAVLDFFKIKC